MYLRRLSTSMSPSPKIASAGAHLGHEVAWVNREVAATAELTAR
jgi:hypothetical protein